MKIGAILLLPFTLLYEAIVRLRNHLFDIGYTRSVSFEIPVILVGNLTAGGSGKTPMIEYLVRLLQGKFETAILSRGYKRRTKGFRIAKEGDSDTTIGDEPMQYFTRWQNKVCVAVGEDRVTAIPEILYAQPDTQVVLMDDGFQHRFVEPRVSIVLTAFKKPFYKDYLMPSGRLREPRREIRRADIIIVTKCPPDLEPSRLNEIAEDIYKYAGKATPIYFTTIQYDEPVALNKADRDDFDKVILITGIANPDPLVSYVQKRWDLVTHIKFKDHHTYTLKNARDMAKVLSSLGDQRTMILTTEKDAARLTSKDIFNTIRDLPIFYIPINTQFLNNGSEFDEYIVGTVALESKK